MRSLPRLAFFRVFAIAAFSLIPFIPFIAGCEEKSTCESVCVHVAECRREVPDEEKMLGEKTPHQDKLCKERCETNPEGFTACEQKKKNCSDLLTCTGRF